MKKRGLNKGISALLSLSESNQNLANEILNLNIEQIYPNRYQPRQSFNQESLHELAISIKEQGLLQPIVVRKINDHYELVAGERRLQACKLAQIVNIHAIVRDLSDEQIAVMALVENLQRENLTALEQANALHKLQQEFNFSQQQMADSLGKSRSTITNLLRLLGLNNEVKQLLNDQQLEMGHARALLGLNQDQQLKAAKQVINQQLTVRQTEELVRNWNDFQALKKTKVIVKVDPNIAQMQQDLASKINFPVKIKCNNQGNGKLVISYNSLDNLHQLLNLFHNN